MSFIETSQLDGHSSKSFLLVLDKLSYNFEELLEIWACKKKNSNLFKFQKFEEGYFRQQLTITRDIATAMKHLHEKNIMHRDLKPANIGFNSQGC